ncbi:hypothetical protein P7228_14760 [Altererythrobacter arenosus]|uniref:Uncharacterized protein n=1 Tax=Altererythrobacter arenosus TaxID=3032592 RepID=A0ABY8FQE5_9SPHN|nr:hypothetical protein [Altererythrobacter sp. CAU 1644]WFL77232.1 hypothetical protein P7228_14760 [Altererythrobacter sp. CAU 1644]
MELIVPFMLFILGISEDDATDIQLSRHPVLYETEQECLTAGQDLIRTRVVAEHENATYFRAFCQRVPAPEEYESLFSERDSARKKQPAEQAK